MATFLNPKSLQSEPFLGFTAFRGGPTKRTKRSAANNWSFGVSESQPPSACFVWLTFEQSAFCMATAICFNLGRATFFLLDAEVGKKKRVRTKGPICLRQRLAKNKSVRTKGMASTQRFLAWAFGVPCRAKPRARPHRCH